MHSLKLPLMLILVTPFGCRPTPGEDLPGSVAVAPGVSYVLEDGEEYHRDAPETFEIPSRAEREALRPNQIVKLMFRIVLNGESQVERMWVVVEGKEGDDYVGTLDNQPVSTQEMRPGLRVRFQPRHVVNIYLDKNDQQKPRRDGASEPAETGSRP